MNMIKIGFLNENGDIVAIQEVGSLVEVSGEPYIVEEIEGTETTLINEEQRINVNTEEIDGSVIEVNESDNTGSYKDEFMCLGESALGEVYCDVNDNVYLNEAKIEMYWPYRSKKGNKPVLVGEVKNDVVEFWDEKGKLQELEVDEFNKQYKKGSAEDLDLFEEMNETAGLDVKKTAVNGKTVTVWINDKKYSYEPTNGMSAKEAAAKFESIAKYSAGKALAWLKKNAETKDSYKKK